MQKHINDYAKKIYEQNKAVGWWDNPNRCIFQTLQLVSTEIAEATEGERKDLMDDHLPNRKMGEVELADTLIRLLDLAGRYGWNYDPHVRAFDECLGNSDLSIAAKHFYLNVGLVRLGMNVMVDGKVSSDFTVNHHYSALVSSIIAVCECQFYDLRRAVDDKLEYNKNRADHKRENRDKQGGKKF